MPVISVIVPIYRVENFLDRCVQSVLDQTFEDFELILVDDGSPDNCGTMCDAWAEKDSRIRVIHKENGGLSDARNAGVAVAKGEWLSFVDSDDYIHPKMLEALYRAVGEHDVKVSICGYAETHGEPITADDFTSKTWKPADFYWEHNVNATIACGKLYHKDTVLPYPIGKIHEDEYVTYRILFALDSVAVVAAPLYGYYINPEGITKSKWNPKRLDCMGAFEQKIAFFKQQRIDNIRKTQTKAYLQWTVTQIVEIRDLGEFHKEHQILMKAGKPLLRQCLKEGLISRDREAWMCAVFYPRSTALWCTLHAVGKRMKWWQ